MNLLEKLFAIATVVKKGECLQNPETWKNSSALMSFFLGLLALIPQFFPEIPLDASKQSAIAFGIVTVIGVFNSYVHLASSSKVGL